MSLEAGNVRVLGWCAASVPAAPGPSPSAAADVCEDTQVHGRVQARVSHAQTCHRLLEGLTRIVCSCRNVYFGNVSM